MKKSTIVVVAIIIIAAFVTGVCRAEGTAMPKENLELLLLWRIDDAARSNKPQEAKQWAEALNAYRQSLAALEESKALEAGNAVLRTYGNVIKSAPAALSGVEKFATAFNDPDTLMLCKVARTLLKLAERPLTAEEVGVIADLAIAQERKTQELIKDIDSQRNK